MNQVDSILIKTKSGQLKTVSLGVGTKPIQKFQLGQNNLDGLNGKKVFLFKHEPIKKSEPVQTKQEIKEKEKISEPLAFQTIAPAFYFDLGDEQEVAKFRNKEQINQQRKHKTTLEYLSEQIIQSSNLDLPASVTNRFKRIIDSRFREIRNLRETKEVLVRPRELGGLGLENESAQHILKLIEEQRLKISEGLPDNFQSALRPVKQIQDYEKDKLVTDIKTNLVEKIKPISSFIHPSYKMEEKKVPGQVKPVSEGIIRPRQSVFEAKAKDQRPAKFEPRLMGPIEELASFDLESFRALAPDIQQILEKIKHKIDLLEDESFIKRAQGIQAWQSSEVYQNYLQLGQESLAQGQSVQEVIRDKQNQNQPTLSFEEFEAVADLNEEMAY